MEGKDLIEWIVNKFKKLIGLAPISEKVDVYIMDKYVKGLDKTGIHFGMNFTKNDERTDLLRTYVNSNI